MKRFKNIFIILGLIALGATIYGYLEYTRTFPSLADVEASAQLDAATLIAAFETDESGATVTYVDKVLEISGILTEIRDENNFITLTLSPESGTGSILCDMDSTFAEKARALQIDSKVAIKGECKGFNADELLGSDVILNRCVTIE
jgi:hypothetical protein